MKYLLLLTVLSLFSCSKDEDPICKTCYTVVSDDLYKQIGVANDGFDVKSKELIGSYCDDELNSVASIKTVTSIGNHNGTSYTILTKIVCE